MEKKTNVWKKEGIIFDPKMSSISKPWMASHGYIPTPYVINDKTIRIYVSFWDKTKEGRIGFVDVDIANPFNILGISERPALDIGGPGTFDDSGVSPLTVLDVEDKLYLYYAGWQLSHKVRYFLFSGLAVSHDKGISFQRTGNVPILDRLNEEYLVRSALTPIKDNGIFKGIYAGGHSMVSIDGKSIPSYCFNYIESKNGIHWPGKGLNVLNPLPGIEFGFGRPCILKEDGIFKMWYSIRSFEKKYKIGYAESKDLKNWIRLDDQVKFISDSTTDYDDEMMCFSAILRTKYGSYMFYNGNGFGETGICFAKEV